MADFNSQHTGVQIDEAIGNALADHAKVADLTQKTAYYVNKNLLDNAYFGGAEIWAKSGSPYYASDGSGQKGTLSADTVTVNKTVSGWAYQTWAVVTVSGAEYMVERARCYQKPGTGPVNQRGETSYIGTSIYRGIDRYVAYKVEETITDDCTVISNKNGVNGNVGQRLENPSILVGKTLTYSVLMEITSNPKDISMSYRNETRANSSLLRIKTGTESAGIDLYTVTFTAASNFTGVGLYLYSNSTGINPTIKVKACKLELGSQQTLAHKEGDTWVLNEVPDYGEELRKCQRYLYMYGANAPIATGYAYTDSSVIAVAHLPVTMRANPTIIAKNVYVRQGSKLLTAGNVLNYAFGGNTVQLFSNQALSGLTAGQGVDIYLGQDSNLGFSAEL